MDEKSTTFVPPSGDAGIPVRHIVIALILVGLAVYLVKDWNDERSERATKIAERQRLQREARESVSRLAARHNAVTDWEARLSNGEIYRITPILSIEVEIAWKVGRPILFVGSIKDILAASATHYQVVLEKEPFVTDYDFDTTLRLSLQAPKSMIDKFLERHPKAASGDGLDNRLAVVAMVARVSADEKFNGDKRIDFKIGHGELIDLIYLGDVWFSKEPEEVVK